MGINSAAKAKTSHTQRDARKAVRATGLADALFGQTQQGVLALLFGQPERRYFTTELIQLVGAGSGAVQRELKRLVDSGLVRTERVGNQKYYRANPDAPIFDALHDIVVKTLGPAEVIRTVLGPLADRLKLAVMYGSVARRADRADSDIDLLLVSDALMLEQVYAALAPAERRLGRRINPSLYTSAEFKQRRADANPFLSRVLGGEYILLMEDKDDLIAPG